MLFTCVKGIGYPSTRTAVRFRQSDPAHRRATKVPCDGSLAYGLSPFKIAKISFFSLSVTACIAVEMTGFEPVAFALQRRCSPTELHPQAYCFGVGLTGFEPVTPALSAQCSNQLSYKPEVRTLNN
jgi:hypothetical protein